jgi:hypothetical protein
MLALAFEWGGGLYLQNTPGHTDGAAGTEIIDHRRKSASHAE